MAKSLASLATGDLFNRVLRFAAFVVLARALSLEEFGAFNTAIAGAGLVAIVATVGLTDLGTREVAIAPRDASHLNQRILLIRLAVLLIICVPPLVVGTLTAPGSVLLLTGALAMALAMTVACDWVLRGLEQMKTHGAAWTAGGATVVAGALVVAWASGSAVGAIWAYAAGEAVVAAVGWVALRKRLRPGLSAEHWRPLLKRAWPLALSNIVIYAYTANLDTIILAATRSTDEAGLYSAPYRGFWVLTAVVVFASYAALPKLSRRSAAGDELTVRTSSVLLGRVLACYATLMVGLTELAGGHALRLVFGERFEQMDGVTIVLVAALVWYAIGFPAGQSLIASNRARSFFAGAAAAGSANVATNLVAIPLYGPIGAAWATTLSFAIGALVWLRLRGVGRAAGLYLVGAAGTVTAGAVVASEIPSMRPSIGLVTLALALVLAVTNVARVRAAW